MKKTTLFVFLFLSFQLFSQEFKYEIINTSINSKYAELGVTYLNANEVLFASSKKTSNDKNFKKDRRVNNRQMFVDLYRAVINDEGDLIQTNRFTNDINNMFYVSDITFTSDLKTTYFTWNNFYNTTGRKDSAEWKKLHIVKANVNNNLEVSNFVKLPFYSKEYSIMQPELSKDGKKLYFISDMPNGYGNTDIYVVDINDDGTYGKPKNLGPNVNTSQSESYPFIDKDNTLYFSSYGHNAKGGLDIFKSDFKNGEFQKATALPEPINSKNDDFAFVVNSSNNTGFFTSNRKKGKGDVDIYGFKLSEKEIQCNQLISGIVLNKKTKKILKGATLSLFNNENELIEAVISDKNANYTFNLNCNENYKITVEKENYITTEIEFETNDTLDFEIKNKIELEEIECSQTIAGLVYNKQTKEPLTDVTINLFKDNEIIDSVTTNENSSFRLDANCNSNYVIITKREGFLPTEIKLKTTSEFDFENIENIELTPTECQQLLSGTIVNKLNGEPVISTSILLLENNKTIASEKLNSNFNFKFELNCDKNYTVKIEKDGFETAQIDFNTSTERDLEFSKTFELTPIECNQSITGIISNKNNGDALTNVKVTLFKNNEIIDSQITENDANYNFDVKCDENYKIVAEKDGFEPFELTLQTNEKNDAIITKNISLTQLVCNQLVIVSANNKLTKEQLYNVKVSLVLNGKTIQTQNIGSDKQISFQLTCDKNYTIIAEKTGFESVETKLNTSNERDLEFSKTFELTPIECNQSITGIISNKNNEDTLTNVKISLYKNNEIIDSQITENDANYNFDVKCDENYKLIAEKDGFEPFELTLQTNGKNEAITTKNISLTPLVCNQLISGVVIDEHTKEQLNNLQISLFQNNVKLKTITLRNLKFEFQLDCDTSYKLVVEKTNYKNSEIEINTTDVRNSNIEKTINLEPLECKYIVRGSILDKITKLPVPNVKVNILKGELNFKELDLSNNASFLIELDCKEAYSFIFSAPNYQNNLWEIPTTSGYNNSINQTFYLSEEEVFETVQSKKSIKTKPIYFDLDKSSVSQNAIPELEKVVATLKKYPNLKIEVKSHTDSRASDNYNLELSENRAKSVANYIISKGIDASKVIGKGYGETQLLNKCSNGIKCTEAEHRANRRTEFIVIEE
ncbi:OmpA family protein [uncultured Lutibacter sp.]|uniref:OmpA family protein n=1 Tax=uncultured Lutibacter sp. TaxID=437739 RepID=UPI00260C14FB|nr:OmpA family protein [uncultured Lutibacter sp.]